jgi:hypothetical protein
VKLDSKIAPQRHGVRRENRMGEIISNKPSANSVSVW